MTDIPFVRSAVQEKVQWGAEALNGRGTQVPANLVLEGIIIEPGHEADVEEHRPQGSRFATRTISDQFLTTWDISGRPAFNDLFYIFSGLFGAPVTTTPVGGTLSRQHVWTLGKNTALAPRTYSIEHGKAEVGGVDKYAALLFKSYSLEFARGAGGTGQGGDAISSFMDRDADDGGYDAFTANPTTPVFAPLVGGQMLIFMDDVSGDIGTTELLSDYSGSFEVGDLYEEQWFLNRNVSSYGGIAEQMEPDFAMTLTMVRNAVANGLIPALRDGETRFVRLDWLGGLIEGAINYALRIDVACQVNEPIAFGEENNASSAEANFLAVHDNTWGKAIVITLVNRVAALA